MNVDLSKIKDELLNSGSEIVNIDEILLESNELIESKKSLEEILDIVAKNISDDTNYFLNQKNEFNTNYISGISSCIYVPDYFENGEFKLKIIGGNRNRFNNDKVDENTLFDVASITKLYMLTLLFVLSNEGIIDLNEKISDLDEKYKKLEDFTFNDLIRLHGEIATEGRITDANNEEDAYRILETAYLKSNDRTQNKYTDIGAIIMSKVLEKVIFERTGNKLSFEEIMNNYLFEKLDLKHTTYSPSTLNLSGNGALDNKAHDPKSRLLGPVGSAGIFVNSDDLAKLSRNILSDNFLSIDLKSRYGEITFQNSSKGNLGIYVKRDDGLNSSYTPSDFSTGSFSHQGWTGSVATFDPNNVIHQNILVNAVYKSDNIDSIKNDKPLGFHKQFKEYEIKLVEKTMLIYIVKNYYNKFLNNKENIDKTIKL